ncbi:MAG: hypothetical protein WA830_13955 [Candidatus Sulfotelmatobacter sp.]
MKKNRLAKPVVVAAGFILLCAAAGQSRAQSASPGAAHTPMATSSGTHPKTSSVLEDDFAGLNYTDEQKTEIEKIHLNTKSLQDKVAKDDKLTGDQKDAMLLGYTRMEYGEMFKVLTPEQQKQVRQKMRARRAADQAARQKQNPMPSQTSTPVK